MEPALVRLDVAASASGTNRSNWTRPIEIFVFTLVEAVWYHF